MVTSPSVRVPSYRLQRVPGKADRAFVELDGQRIYLGTYGSPESKVEYDRVLAEWMQRGRRPEVPTDEVTVIELVAAFWAHATDYYKKTDGTETSTISRFTLALRPLKSLYAETPVCDFTPSKLKAVRQRMVDTGWNRTTINSSVGLIRQMFRWGVENELVKADVLAALRAVSPLKAGRCGAPEGRKVKPVPMAYVDAIKPFVSKQVWALIQLQVLTGARCGELVIMRAIDLDTTGKVWTYKPAEHKTAHHGHDRAIYIGPRAQDIIAPFMAGRPVDAFLFDPREADAQRRAALHARRRTPLSCGNKPGSNRARKPSREPGERYTTKSFHRAIERGCDLAFIPPAPLARMEKETHGEHMARLTNEQKAQLHQWRREHRWHPHQLRHSRATELRKAFGLDLAKVVLGHSDVRMTERYAEADVKAAMEAMAKVG